MNEAAILKQIGELSESLGKLPSANAGSEGVYLPSAVAAKSSIEESLDNLRLQLRYLMFDLEATRRENRYLRQMLENRPPFRKGDDDHEV